MEVCNIAQQAVTKIIPKKKKCKKAKWLSEETLQIAEKRREEEAKEKREDIPSDAEYQRMARRDEKAFLSEQCKEIEENNKMGKTSDHLKKKIRYQGNISFKDGHNKGQKWKGPNKSRRD